jgi:hypothetical protein
MLLMGMSSQYRRRSKTQRISSRISYLTIANSLSLARYTSCADARAFLPPSQTYHRIREVSHFERHGLVGVYDRNHPDERLSGKQPLLLFLNGKPIGAVRLDRVSDELGIIRTVVIDQATQGNGHGRCLLDLVVRRARTAGLKTLDVNAHPTAQNFLRAVRFQAD